MIFGSKRSLLRSAFTRWYTLEENCKAFNSKIRICNAPGEKGEKLRRRIKRFIFDKNESKGKRKKGVDILKELKLKTPHGWKDLDARKMFWKIYVEWPVNETSGHRQSAVIVNKAAEADHSIKRVLLPRYQMWVERKEGALALKKELKMTMTKQTSLLNSRLPGGTTGLGDSSTTLNELYDNDETETNMEELNDEIDRVAKEREYWRQKVIEYQVRLDQMVSKGHGKSLHEMIGDETRQQDVHENLNQSSLTWELT